MVRIYNTELVMITLETTSSYSPLQRRFSETFGRSTAASQYFLQVSNNNNISVKLFYENLLELFGK